MRKNSSQSTSGFPLKLFIYTFVLALTFGAGLIVGQRLGDQGSLLSMISNHTEVKEEIPIAVIDTGEEEVGTDYSFYDLLGERPQANGQRKKRPSVVVPKKVAEVPSETPALEKAPEVAKADVAPKEVAPVAEDPAKDEADQSAKFTLQFGSHPSKSEADDEMAKLKRLGLEPYLLTVKIPKRGTFYRVRVGMYETLAEARSAQSKLQSEKKISGFVSPI